MTISSLSGGGNIAPVNIPTGYRWTNPPINIRRLDGRIVTDFDITIYKPTVVKTYYVDPINGNNGNAGTIGAPLLDVAVALAKVDVDEVRLILTADYIARGAKGWNNTQPTRSLSLINETGFRFICPSWNSSSIPTWTVNGTFGNVYQTVSSSANSSNVTDFKPSLYRVIDSRVPSAFQFMIKVADLATVSATPGSWFNDGTNTYVRAIDDRNLVGDIYMQTTTNSNSGRFPSVNNATMYVKGVDFVGGRPWYSFLASTVTGTKLVAENCSFQCANVVGGSNGLNIAAFQDVYLYRCAAWNNGADDWNFHSFESDGTTPGTSPQVIAIECANAGGGTTGSANGSDNAFTAHDFCNAISINCNHGQSDDRAIAMTNSAHAWVLGGTCAQAKQVAAAKESIAALESANIWLDSVTASPGANPRWTAEQTTSKISHYNSGPVVNAPGALGKIKSYYG